MSIPINPLRSKEGEQALEIMEASTKYLSNEIRWETGLLWSTTRPTCPIRIPWLLKGSSALRQK